MTSFIPADFFEQQEQEAAAAKLAKPRSPSERDSEDDFIPLSANHDAQDAVFARVEEDKRRREKRERDHDRYDSEARSQDAGSQAGSSSAKQRTGDARGLKDNESGTKANSSRHGRLDRSPRSRSPGSHAGSRSHRYRSRSRDRYRRDDRDGRHRSSRDYYRSDGRDDRDYARRRDYGRLEPINDDDYAPRSNGKDGDKRKYKDEGRSQEERDRCTVMVTQIAARAKDKHLTQFFDQRVGHVIAVQMVKDRNQNRSKGIAYVEFASEEYVEEAVKLTGQKLLDIPIIVAYSESEKNQRAKVESQPASSTGGSFLRLYVGNIHFSVAEADLEAVFKEFGELEFVHLQRDENGRSKGFAFVQFTSHEDAKIALDALQGFEIAGRNIRVGLGNHSQKDDHAVTESRQEESQSGTFGRGGRGQHAGGTGVFDRANNRDAERTGGASALDDNDLGGVNFNNVSRDALMRRLARTEDTSQSAGPRKAAAPKPTAEPEVVTRCIVLKNMWTREDTLQKDWQTDVSDDVGRECNQKYGIVVFVGIDPSSTEGEVYVKFDRPEGGKNAYQGLNGRFFGGQAITASYLVDAVFDVMFPQAARV